MRITEIEPSKKYVLVLPKMNVAQTREILTSLRAFMEDDVHVLFAIGADVLIVPADQITGYTTLE